MTASIAPGAEVGHFRVEAEIGRGGMGVVYRAVDLTLGRTVALKVLPPELVGDPARRARFVREARSAAAVSHPSIAVIYEIAEHAGAIAIAMEWIDGQTLRARIQAAPIALDEVLAVAVAVAAGVTKAHEAGVVHRDLKPENVMVAGDGVVKILDFGLAKQLSTEEPTAGDDGRLITIDGHVLGTPEYMSPEQAKGHPVDTRSDVFSFGAMLYELATGTRPFVGETRHAVREAVIHHAPPPLPTAVPELARIVDKCLAKDRGDRYQTMADLAVDLRRLQRGRAAALPTVSGSMPPTPDPMPARADLVAAPATTPSIATTVISGAPSRSPLSGDRRRWPRIATGLLVVAVVAAAVIATVAARRPRRVAPSTAPGSPAPATTPAPLPDLAGRPVTTNALENHAVHAALSPDGRYLAYVDVTGVWMKLIATGEVRAVAVPAAARVAALAWDVDGTRLLLTMMAGDAASTTAGESASIWQSPLIGGAPTQLVADCAEAAVSPDGRRLACARASTIVVIDRATGSARELVRGAASDEYTDLRWAPDGGHVAFVRHLRGVTLSHTLTLEVIAAAEPAGPPVVIDDAPALQGPIGDVGVVWLPDGRLLYTNNAAGETWLMAATIDLATGRRVGAARVATQRAPLAIDDLTMTADGRQLAYVGIVAQTDIAVGSLAATPFALKRLTLDDANDVVIDWFPDSARVLFASNRTGRVALYQQALDRPEALAVRPEADWRLQRLWPDGTATVTVVPRPGQARHWDVVREPLDTARPSVLAEDIVGDRPLVRCARDVAAGCIVDDVRDGQVVIWRLTGAGARTQVAVLDQPEAARSLELSPDGTRLASYEYDKRLQIIELATGQRANWPLEPECPWQWITWDADGTSLLATCASFASDGYRLYRIDGRGAPTLVYAESVAWLWRPRVSPDGKWVALGRDTLDSDVRIVDAPP